MLYRFDCSEVTQATAFRLLLLPQLQYAKATASSVIIIRRISIFVNKFIVIFIDTFSAQYHNLPQFRLICIVILVLIF